ncbi:hypothetical protein M569_09300 [Genlisea aurea]|uniref:peptidylprolyl isomerase n=1 Tax=Genlisea aurea TaxID=192259 RepID=S8CL64_9LAMI|nr:hypothetical protein M569_09300 [Genlisea aurea]
MKSSSPSSAASSPSFRSRKSAAFHQPSDEEREEDWLSPIKKNAVSILLAMELVVGGFPGLGQAVLISGPPIKDPGALLRYALPIDNKAIREVQKPLEDITESLKNAGEKALDPVERNVRQASRALKLGRTSIIEGLPKSKSDDGIEVLDRLESGLEELRKIVEDRDRDGIAPKQKELLNYVGR